MACQTAPGWLSRNDLETDGPRFDPPYALALRRALPLVLGLSAAWVANFGLFAFLLNYVAGVGAPAAR